MATKVDPGKSVNLVIIIVGSVFGIAAVIFLFVKVNGALKALRDVGRKAIDGADIDQTQLTYTTAQYASFADQLYDAMDGLDLQHSTMVGTVMGVFQKMGTYDDVRKLINAYGTRKVGNFNLFGWEADSQDRNLGQTMAWALERDEIEAVNSLLAAKNINFSF